MPLPRIVKNANGRIDVNHEKEIAILWFNEKRIEWSHIDDSTRRGFYLLKRKKRQNKIYICCTSNIGTRNNARFWFGLDHYHFKANPDMGLVMIGIWENGVRDYICFPNSFVRFWVKYWYQKNDYYSIDIDIIHGKYLMKIPKENIAVDEYVNNIHKIFEKIDFLNT